MNIEKRKINDLIKENHGFATLNAAKLISIRDHEYYDIIYIAQDIESSAKMMLNDLSIKIFEKIGMCMRPFTLTVNPKKKISPGWSMAEPPLS